MIRAGCNLFLISNHLKQAYNHCNQVYQPMNSCLKTTEALLGKQ